MTRAATGPKRPRLRRLVAASAAAAVLFSACGADDNEAVAADEPAVEATADSGVLPTVSGGQIDTNSLEGTDTILWFWAPW